MKRHHGFSLTEAIVVIVLIGIVSFVAFSRFMGSDAYNAITLRDQIVSMTRSAQQKAIGRSDVVLTIDRSGEDFRFTLEARVNGDMETVQSARTPARTVTLRADVNEQASCGALGGAHTVTADNAMVIAFDQLGDLFLAGVENTASEATVVSTGVRLCVNNDPVMSVCVSKAGFAYVGDCDD